MRLCEHPLLVQRGNELRSFFWDRLGFNWQVQVRKIVADDTTCGEYSTLNTLLQLEPLAIKLGWIPTGPMTYERNFFARLNVLVDLLLRASMVHPVDLQTVIHDVFFPRWREYGQQDDMETPDSLGFEREFNRILNPRKPMPAALERLMTIPVNSPVAHVKPIGGKGPDGFAQ